MAMPDNDFDRWISESLNAEISCYSPKKQAAWQQVALKASRQYILPASEEEFPPVSRIVSIKVLGRRVWDWFTSLAGDETRYDRARVNRHRMYHLSVIGDGSISVHLFEPRHYRWLSPT